MVLGDKQHLKRASRVARHTEGEPTSTSTDSATTQAGPVKPMNTPSTGKVVIAALLGSAAAVLLRALGALLLNDSFTTEQVVHLFTASWVLLRFYAWTVGFFVIAGVPIIRWAYRTGRANLASFGIAGLLAGYASSYPLLMIPSWAALHAASGFAGALTAFLALSVLGRSESTSSSAP